MNFLRYSFTIRSQGHVVAINPRRYSLTVDSFLNSFLRYKRYNITI